MSAPRERTALFGVTVVSSSLLPIDPSPGEAARRVVRHGLADVLRWLGEDVGPRPEDKTNALVIGRTLMASPETVRAIAGDWK